MAIDIIQPLRFVVDLKDGLTQKTQRAILMKGDKNANRIIVTITNGRETVDLTGTMVSGKFIRPPDGAEIALEGEADGNEAAVLLDEHCYATDGRYEASVILTIGEVKRTILLIGGEVRGIGSGAVVDVGDVIPSIDDIIAQYATMKQVTKDAQDAADAANAAAEHAPYIDASNNHWMAWDAETGEYADTGVAATGPTGEPGTDGEDGTDGRTPYIGENGNWWIGETDTGVAAQGPPGANGTGSGTVTGVKIGETTYKPDESGVVTLPEQDDSGNVSYNDATQNIQILSGTVEFTSVASSSTATANLVFSKEFAEIPVVMVCAMSNVGNKYATYKADTVTTTGVELRATNGATATATYGVAWLAIGIAAAEDQEG